jgi:hypothetical protein
MKYKITSQGKGEMKSYRIISTTGDELIDMDFDSTDAAKKYAKKKGIKLTEAMGGKRNHQFDGKDEIGDFWVVTDPGRGQESEMADIFFQADIFDMALQLRGGLKGWEIIGIYKNKAKAQKIAQKLLDLDIKKRRLKEARKPSRDVFPLPKKANTRKVSDQLEKDLDYVKDSVEDWMAGTEIVKDEAEGSNLNKAWAAMDKSWTSFYTRCKAFIRAQKLTNEAVKSSGFTSFKSLFEASIKVKTSKDAGHSHEASVDDEGDGKTTKTIGGKDHVHKIVGGSVEKASGHDHTIKA